MKKTQQATRAGGIVAGTSLSSLVTRLAVPVLRDATNTKTIFINEISPDLFTVAEESSIAPLIKELISTVVRSARNGRIHVRAERFRDLIVLEIEERNNYNGYALAYTIETLAPLARNIGGYISMKNQQKLETTISFQFLNKQSLNEYLN